MRTDDALLVRQLASLLDTRDWLTNAAQTCAFIFHEIADLNWVGFYLLQGNELILGPFQGKPACNPIPVGKGVCGTAACTRETQLVEDVHAFSGHIVCDVVSRAELVVPVLDDGRLWGVLDIDSPLAGRFGEADQVLVEKLCDCFVAATDFVHRRAHSLSTARAPDREVAPGP